MKLLDVKAVLDREKDIQKTDPKGEILKERDDKYTGYAILSHRWGAEVNYEEMTGLTKMGEGERNEVRERCGCCIDKQSSTELNDVDEKVFPVKRDEDKFDKSNGWPE